MPIQIQIVPQLLDRKHELEEAKAQIEADLPSFPEGTLNISPQSAPRKGYHYYWGDGHGRGTYIKKGSEQLVQQLAQKDYDIKLLRRIDQELKQIDRHLKLLSHDCPEDLYASLPMARQAIVSPVILPDEEYIRQWKAETYTGKPFKENEPEHYAKSVLRVRSKSEEMIANTLDQMNIPYKYECPLILSGWGTIYPDFTVLHVRKRKKMLWEHFGMMDNADYASHTAKKISKYMAEGYYPGENLIMTFESQISPFSTFRAEEICRHYFPQQEL